jgi:hypothetical protein
MTTSGCYNSAMGSKGFARRARISIIVIPLLVLVFNLRNKFPMQNILVDLFIVSAHLDPNRGKTTNRVRGRVHGPDLPFSMIIDPIIRRPANLRTWAQKLHVFPGQSNVPKHPLYISWSDENAVTASIFSGGGRRVCPGT